MMAVQSRYMWWLIAITLAACVARLVGLEAVSMSHPEIYIPGIDLVAGISEPPQRHDTAFTLWWHFHDEPHPMGWYLGMFGWTKLFGTSEFMLRLPGVIFATLTIPMIFLLGRRAFSPTVGLVAAAMLALHAFHIEWSQIARMYVPAAFYSVLSLWLAMRILEAPDRSLGREVAYVAVLITGVQTTELYWAILGMQIGWLILIPARDISVGINSSIGRLAQLQSIAIMASAMSLLQSVYRARGGAAGEPTPGFIVDYLSFGFLFEFQYVAVEPVVFPIAMIAAVFLLALCLTVFAFRWPAASAIAVPERKPMSLVVLAIMAVVFAAFTFWLSTIAHRRNTLLAVVALGPILALALPYVIVFARSLIARVFPWIYRITSALGPDRLLIALIALGPPLVFYVLSFKMSVLASRAFMVFLPALLILLAAGTVLLCRRPVLRLAIPVLLAAIFAGGLAYREAVPVLPNDYKALAHGMIPKMQDGDLVFVRKKSWVDTPFFYYLPDANYVAEDYSDALSANPEARVWMITWPDAEAPEVPGPRRAALEGYTQQSEIIAVRARAELFVRP